MRSARSKTLFLLLSVAAAFGVLAWSAQHGTQAPGRIIVVVVPAPGVSFLNGLPDAIIGDSVSVVGRSSSCTTWTWGGGKPPTSYPCLSASGRDQFRKVP